MTLLRCDTLTKLIIETALISFDEVSQNHDHTSLCNDNDKRSIMVLMSSAVFCFTDSVSWV